MQPKSDAQLLREYAERADEAAFREIVTRHAGLVYSAALRQVDSPDLAGDVAQNVFTDLARKARSVADTLKEDSSLVGWLYRGTRFEALDVCRSELRRRSRERQAMQEMSPSPDTTPDWDRIRPALDAAMAELTDTDREALLLRFFKNQELREVGRALGVNDDAAQKRVSRALDKLREILSRHGVSTAAGALGIVVSANAVQAAPLGLVTEITTGAVITGATVHASTTVTKTIAMTTLQKTIIGATLIAAVSTAVYEAQNAATLRNQLAAARLQQAQAADGLRQLKNQIDEAATELAALQGENDRLKRDTSELIKMRGEIGRLRNDSRELAQLKTDPGADATISEAVAWKQRVGLLKQYAQQNPAAAIPELQWVTEQDWLDATRGKLETEKDYRRAMSSVRHAAESKFAPKLHEALNQFMDANNKEFPTALAQLQPYFKEPLDEAVLQRYAILPREELSSLGMGGKWIISQKAAVDPDFDGRIGIGPNGWGTIGTSSWNDPLNKIQKTLEPVLKAYAAANGGNQPKNPSDLLPYLKTPEQKDAFEKGLKALEAAKE